MVHRAVEGVDGRAKRCSARIQRLHCVVDRVDRVARGRVEHGAMRVHGRGEEERRGQDVIQKLTDGYVKSLFLLVNYALERAMR